MSGMDFNVENTTKKESHLLNLICGLQEIKSWNSTVKCSIQIPEKCSKAFYSFSF